MSFKNDTSKQKILSSKEDSKKKLKDFLKSFLMPTIVGKTLVLYFGIHYSMYPGEGYGYGLIGAIAFTLFGLFKFLWKYKDQEDI